MIKAETLPYVDLGLPADSLRDYALEHFGKKISSNAKDETVVERFKAIYQEETGVTLPDVEPVAGTVDDDDEKPPEKPARKLVAATILIHDDPKDPSPVCGGVNFKSYRIKRNVNVKVSIPILRSLENAMKTVYDPDTMAPKEVRAYPFSIVEMHYE